MQLINDVAQWMVEITGTARREMRAMLKEVTS